MTIERLHLFIIPESLGHQEVSGIFPLKFDELYSRLFPVHLLIQKRGLYKPENDKKKLNILNKSKVSKETKIKTKLGLINLFHFFCRQLILTFGASCGSVNIV